MGRKAETRGGVAAIVDIRFEGQRYESAEDRVVGRRLCHELL
jgi:hypothetical protein